MGKRRITYYKQLWLRNCLIPGSVTVLSSYRILCKSETEVSVYHCKPSKGSLHWRVMLIAQMTDVNQGMLRTQPKSLLQSAPRQGASTFGSFCLVLQFNGKGQELYDQQFCPAFIQTICPCLFTRHHLSYTATVTPCSISIHPDDFTEWDLVVDTIVNETQCSPALQEQSHNPGTASLWI